jgi:hypothetical protein
MAPPITTNAAEPIKLLEAKHEKEFEALRLLWDKDRKQLRKIEEENRILRKENEELIEKFDIMRKHQAIKNAEKDDEKTLAAIKGDPLFRKGAEVRLRLWELNKSTLYKTPRANLKQAVIEAGNIAAHQQDVEADAALFKHGYLLENIEGDTFKEIYGWSPGSAELFMSKFSPSVTEFRALAECEGMVRMNIPKDSQTMCTTQSVEWSNLKCKIIGYIAAPSDDNTERDIADFRGLTEKLIEMERNLNRRR